MNIVLYKTTSKPNTINKNKSLIKTIAGNTLEPLSVINPSIKIKIDNTVLTSNYVYIANFNRYYYIKNYIINNGFMTLELTVDVLESFKTDILAYNGIIERQEYDYNLYLDDNEISAYSKPLIDYVNFPNSPLSANVATGEKKFVLITTSN